MSKIPSLFKKRGRFSCFTPEVMLATFVVEVIMVVYVFVRYKMSAFSKAIMGIIALLALFQIAEYQICTGLYPLLWAQIGFIAITLLPLLGLYLISLVTGKRHFLILGLLAAATSIFYFVFSPEAPKSALCDGNYIMFDSGQGIYWIIYYFSFLVLGIWEAFEGMTNTKSHRSTLMWIVVGYLSFVLPMSVFYFIFSLSISAFASIMCGFAVLLALILTFKVLPTYYGNGNKKK